MFTLAHLSDPHLGPLPRPRWHELFSKRALGYTNWSMRRGRRHDMRALALLTEDLAAQGPDHIALTGDLAVIGLEAEFMPARAFLDRLGPADRVSVVPGNHDAYVRHTARHAALHWSDYMSSDGVPDLGAPRFPFVRRRGPVAFVGLSSAVPTAPFSAAGRVGAVQAQHLRSLLDRLGADGLFRVVLIHHPPTPGISHLRRLTDWRRVAGALRAGGAELVLHGHNHRPERRVLPGPDGAIPVVGVPSASASPTDPIAPAAYNLYRISGAPGRWRCTLETRGFTPTLAGVGRRAEADLI